MLTRPEPRRSVNADDAAGDGNGLESQLYADLAAAGFPRESINHIEVGRACEEEMLLLRRLHKLRVLEQEIDTRRKHVTWASLEPARPTRHRLQASGLRLRPRNRWPHLLISSSGRLGSRRTP